MSELVEVKAKSCPTCGCVGKNPGYGKLTNEEIDAEFATLAPGVWTLADDYMKITMEFKTRNWKGAIAFINEISVIAESDEVSHHPGNGVSIDAHTACRSLVESLTFSPFVLADVHLTMYRQVEVIIWTHAIGGLTQSDFILAREIEKVKVDYSPKWLETHAAYTASKL